MYLTQFIAVALVHLLAVVSPGPDFVMVTRNSVVYSRTAGIYTAIGIGLGMMVHIAYSLIGIGLLISRSVVLFNVIKYIGAAYLIYIGYKSLRAKAQSSKDVSLQFTETIPAWKAVKIGVLTEVLNPKATLFFFALFTQVISPSTPKGIQLLYGLEMIVVGWIWFVLVAVFFSNSFIRTKISRIQYRLEKAMGVVLIALGIKVALTTHR